MRSADSDKDAGFANLEAAQAVNDGDAMNAVFFVKLSGDPSHFCEGHGLVGFVFEIQRGAIVRLIADEAIEGNDGAVFRCAHMIDQRMRINRLANKLEDVVVKNGCHCFRSATADGWEEGDFITRMEHGIPSGKLLIAGSEDGGAVFGELRNALRIKSKELFDRGGLSEVQRFFRLTDHVFQAAEEKDLYADGLRDRSHKRIVARAGRSSQWRDDSGGPVSAGSDVLKDLI